MANLTEAVHDLSSVLAAPFRRDDAEWMASLNDALVRLEKALEEHIALNWGPDGALADVDTTTASLPRKATELSEQYHSLLEKCAALREELSCATQSATFPTRLLEYVKELAKRISTSSDTEEARIDKEADRLLDGLQKTMTAEDTLKRKADDTHDIGVGD
jgi:hypothetical protein